LVYSSLVAGRSSFFRKGPTNTILSSIIIPFTWTKGVGGHSAGGERRPSVP
jgi:hypothetical protein